MRGSKKKVAMLDKSLNEYRKKRVKNALKQIRGQSGMKAVEARVQKLRTEVECLRSENDNLTRELKRVVEIVLFFSQAELVEYLSPQMKQELKELLLRKYAPTDLDKLSSILAEMRRLQSLHQGGSGGEYVIGLTAAWR